MYSLSSRHSNGVAYPKQIENGIDDEIEMKQRHENALHSIRKHLDNNHAKFLQFGDNNERQSENDIRQNDGGYELKRLRSNDTRRRRRLDCVVGLDFKFALFVRRRRRRRRGRQRQGAASEIASVLLLASFVSHDQSNDKSVRDDDAYDGHDEGEKIENGLKRPIEGIRFLLRVATLGSTRIRCERIEKKLTPTAIDGQRRYEDGDDDDRRNDCGHLLLFQTTIQRSREKIVSIVGERRHRPIRPETLSEVKKEKDVA